MDFVARAKALMGKQARTAALVVLPLAAAVSAQATPTLPIANFACSSTPGICTASAGDALLPEGGNGLIGVKFFTSGGLIISNTSGGTAQLLMQASDLMNETFGGDIPLAYLFTISGSISTWTLGYSLSQTSGGGYFTSVSGSGSGTFSGSTSFTGVSLLAGLMTNNNFLLTVSFSGGTVTADIPSSSIDFNAAPAAVPEPSTAALVGLAIALSGGWKLVRRRNRLLLIRPKSESAS